MISVDEALTAILSRFSSLGREERPLLQAVGQVLAEDVVAPFDVPPLTNAAMDGYAVRATDTEAATERRPIRLRVVEDLPAGRCAVRSVEPGTAIRIMTGAPLPDGADTVVQFELTGEGRGEPRGAEVVAIYGPCPPALNIRHAGEDLKRGEVTLCAGAAIRPAEVGVLATMGRTTIPVHRRPRVAILSTGDELLQPGEPWSPGKIYDANAFTLAAMVERAGGVPLMLGAAPDRLDELVARVDALEGADLLVTSAGVSTGDYDVVKQALTSLGDVSFYQVRMRPGRPLAFGTLRGVPLLGLPGNPVASAISFELFGRPALRKMLGYTGWARPEVGAVFEGSVDNYDRRRSFYRVTLREGIARLTGPQGSGISRSLALADGLMVVPEDTATVQSGDAVRVWLID